MSKFLSDLINKDLMDNRYSEIYASFVYESDLVGLVEVPRGFIHDYESVPIIRGTSKRGGVLHDYLSRNDSIPLVSKAMAAKVYLVANELRDSLTCNSWWSRFEMCVRRHIKRWVVAVAPGYFHKHRVMATYQELTG